jgi:hypothetical protein
MDSMQSASVKVVSFDDRHACIVSSLLSAADTLPSLFVASNQFLRGYVERCNEPAIRNLVTFGSQHMGISDLPACKPTDFFCRLAEGALRGGVYTDYAQSNVVTAQYFRDPTKLENYEKYLESNRFLPDINNERVINETYKDRLMSLNSLVLLMFDKDIVSLGMRQFLPPLLSRRTTRSHTPLPFSLHRLSSQSNRPGLHPTPSTATSNNRRWKWYHYDKVPSTRKTGSG